MSAHSISSILDLLRGGKLLGSDELEVLESLRSHARTASGLVSAVLKRGLLTTYQARELFSGRGEELRLGEFVVLEKLGEGSTAVVFKVHHRASGRILALKVLREDSLGEGSDGRLSREQWAGSRLDHRNILRTYGSGQDGETHFLIMEHAAGRTLARLLREHGPLPPGRASDYARQASLGLAHALERGLVHRDVKPSNLLLTAETNTIKVLDFGIACRVGDRVLAAGTPDYVAPEQVFESGAADTRSDVYALGCTLYHLLTGTPPFLGGSREEKLLRHREEEPRPIEELRPDLPSGLGEVVRKAMKKSPGERYSEPGDLASALVPFAEPGDCDSFFVLDFDERGLEDLDPSKATDILLPELLGTQYP